ncbi:hypothetical protein COT72_00005 [archaeon CG10_big_fil_rev_8_21_14_0_10_43_11]|nr:MAG: hypothetical protein COT72_00005 [archaeon CG10_big_fil_rev_8_21_14_0_10_43_11]
MIDEFFTITAYTLIASAFILMLFTHAQALAEDTARAYAYEEALVHAHSIAYQSLSFSDACARSKQHDAHISVHSITTNETCETGFATRRETRASVTLPFSVGSEFFEVMVRE